MGFFDALSSGYFKTGADGHHLFFPYGAVGRGYVLRSQDEYERLRGKVNKWTMATPGCGGLTVPVPWIVLVLSVLVTLPFMLLYAAWARSVTRDLERTAERMTWSESRAAYTHKHIVWLWLLQNLAALGIAGCVIYLLIRFL